MSEGPEMSDNVASRPPAAGSASPRNRSVVFLVRQPRTLGGPVEVETILGEGGIFAEDRPLRYRPLPLPPVGGDATRRAAAAEPAHWAAAARTLVEWAAEARGAEVPLRVKLVFEDGPSALAELPWETLATTAPGMLGATFPGVMLLRCVPCPAPVPRETVTDGLRIAFVLGYHHDPERAVRASSVAAVRAGIEAAQNEQETREAWHPYHSRVFCADRPAARLASTLRDYNPHVVHFIGRCEVVAGQGNLCWEWAEGEDRKELLDASALADALPTAARLVCLSSFAPAQYAQQVFGLHALVRGFARFASASGSALPSVVFQTAPVLPEYYERFWRSFYGGLVESGGDLDAAIAVWRQDPPPAGGAKSLPPETGAGTGFALCVRDHDARPFHIPAASGGYQSYGTPGGPVPPRGDTPSGDQAERFRADAHWRLTSRLARRIFALGAVSPEAARAQREYDRSYLAALEEAAQREPTGDEGDEGGAE